MEAYKGEGGNLESVTQHINMKVLCLLALGLAVVAAEISVDVTQELDRMARPEDRSEIFRIFNLIVKFLDKGKN